MENINPINVNALIETFSLSEPSVPLLNGYVVYLMHFSSDASSINKLSEQLALKQHLAQVDDESGLRKISNAVNRLQKEIKRLKCTPTRNWNRIAELLTHPFFVQPSDEIDVSGKEIFIAGPSVSAEGMSNVFFIAGDANMVAGPTGMEEHNYCVIDVSYSDFRCVRSYQYWQHVQNER